MVEEHSSSLNSRIESDYPSSTPAPISSPAYHFQDLKLTDAVSAIAPSSVIKNGPTNDDNKHIQTDQDKLRNGDIKKQDSLKTTSNPIDAKRSKSLNNASSLDSNEEVCKVYVLKKFEE